MNRSISTAAIEHPATDHGHTGALMYGLSNSYSGVFDCGFTGVLTSTASVGEGALRESAKTHKEFVKGALTRNSGRYDPLVSEPVQQRQGVEATLIPDRVMVCMSSARDAPRVIRAGERLARNLAARWYAVYVETPSETPDRIKPLDRAALKHNIALAEELGATIVRVTADTTADGLIAFANREGITHVVFGQTARSRWEILMKGSTLNRFLEEVRDATVQVIPLGESAA